MPKVRLEDYEEEENNSHRKVKGKKVRKMKKWKGM